MASIIDILLRIKQNPRGIRYNDLCKVCVGVPRHTSGSHRIYKTPWEGDPRINIQNHKGMAKPYQVKQVLLAIQILEDNDGTEK